MVILEELIKMVVESVYRKYKDSPDIQFRDQNDLGSLEKLTYKQCLAELSNQGEKLEFGCRFDRFLAASPWRKT